MMNLPSLHKCKMSFIYCFTLFKILSLYSVFCDFSEHIQGTWVIITKYDIEIEKKAGTTEEESYSAVTSKLWLFT